MAQRPTRQSISRGSAVRQYGALPGTPKPPVCTVAPTITGTPSVGQTLTAVAGTYANSPATVTRKWLRDGVVISGATGTTYVLTSDDSKRSIAVREHATNAQGFISARSAPVVVA